MFGNIIVVLPDFSDFFLFVESDLANLQSDILIIQS